VPAERGHRADDRPKVARVGDAIERDDERHPGGQRVDEVIGVGILGRAAPADREPLVHGSVGDPVEFRSGTFQDRYAALGRLGERFTDPVVGVDAAGDEHRRGGDVGPQRFDDRVAPSDDLGARLPPPPKVGRPGEVGRAAYRPCGRDPAGGGAGVACLAPACAPCGSPDRRPWGWGPCPPGRDGADPPSRPWGPCRSCGPRRGVGSCRPCQSSGWGAGAALGEPPGSPCWGASDRRASDHLGPDAVSSMAIPAAASWSRMASAVAKSRQPELIDGRSAGLLDEGVERRSCVGLTGRARTPSVGRAG
jgi:hypothetical protein